jgi:hypothetical protein
MYPSSPLCALSLGAACHGLANNGCPLVLRLHVFEPSLGKNLLYHNLELAACLLLHEATLLPLTSSHSCHNTLSFSPGAFLFLLFVVEGELVCLEEGASSCRILFFSKLWGVRKIVVVGLVPGLGVDGVGLVWRRGVESGVGA